jgi:TPR repeat protein
LIEPSASDFGHDAIARRLRGSPEERAAVLHELAEQGVVEAQALYGQVLLDGNGVARDRPAAFRWFVKAARRQHLMALNMLGRCYDLGWGTSIDKTRAAECYSVAAERGLDWAMYNYATLLALGEGIIEDKTAALAWFERAAGMGNAKAINFVGSFHEDGWVVPRDIAKAADCYARAAAGGDFRGCFNHARMLGAAGDIDKALDWLAEAGRTATPAFVEKAADWLATAPGFGARAVAALRGNAAC